MKQKEGLLLIISGPSGAGKGTVVQELIGKGGYALSVSATTRSPRPMEQDGVHYFFLSKEDFEQKVAENGFLEYACFCGNFYGTPRAYVEEQMAKGTHVILEIEVQGAFQVKEKFPEAVLLFLVPPSLAELERRLVGRGTEDAETIQKRLNRALEELELMEQYDYLVVNDTVAEAAEDIAAIVRAEQQKCSRQKAFWNEFKGE